MFEFLKILIRTGNFFGLVLNTVWVTVGVIQDVNTTTFIGLTHCGLETPYSDTDLGHHWLR